MCVYDRMGKHVNLARSKNRFRVRNVLSFWYTCSAGLCDESECDASARVVTLSAFAAAFADGWKCDAK